MLEKAIEKIEAQQANLKNTPAYWVGEQLKDMLRAEPWNADLVAQDLDIKEMSITDLEKKIHEKARENGGCCCGKEADRIIREFYGFRPALEAQSPGATTTVLEKKRKPIRLEDFL